MLSNLLQKTLKGMALVTSTIIKLVASTSHMKIVYRERNKRTGFLSGHILVPDDFDTLGSSQTKALFEDAK